MISASRRVEAPSRHRRASSLGEEVVGGLLFDLEGVRTDLTEMLRAGGPEHVEGQTVEQGHGGRKEV